MNVEFWVIEFCNKIKLKNVLPVHSTVGHVWRGHATITRQGAYFLHICLPLYTSHIQ